MFEAYKSLEVWQWVSHFALLFALFVSVWKDVAQKKQSELKEATEIQWRKSTTAELQKANSMLLPLIEIARKKFPSAEPEDALKKLQEEIQNIKTETQRVTDFLAPRRLSESQMKELVSILKNTTKINVELFSSTGSEEISLRGQLSKIFHEASWNVILDVAGGTFGGPPLENIVILVSDESTFNQIRQFGDALSAFGMKVDAVQFPGLSKMNKIIINIGPKT